MAEEATALDALVQEVRRGARYREVSPDLVRRLGEQELARRRTPREAVKATKNRLHQVYGAFLVERPRYGAWLDQLAAAAGATGWRQHLQLADPSQAEETAEPFEAVCRRLLEQHASTAERAAILPAFYRTVLSGLPPIRSVLDLGCGLNPLAIPWMGLPADVRYRCYDIDAALIDFLNRFFALAGVDGRAEVRDVVASPPREAADLALALKLLPTLDQIERDASATLLRALQIPHILVSFPARSLGGREKGMAQQYEARFLALAAREGWAVQGFAFATEIAFLVQRA